MTTPQKGKQQFHFQAWILKTVSYVQQMADVLFWVHVIDL